MSSLIVEVCRVANVEKHPNADRMCVVTVKGWQCCAGRTPDTGENQFKPGDLCVYIPPDSVLPPALSDRLGVTKYLSPLPKSGITGERPPGGRVRVARLRGFPSYGLIMRPDNPSWEEGKDVAEVLGITKWEPPQECTDGDAERPHPAFHAYFTLENLRNFPTDVFVEGEEVVFTEKIHGKNCRVGYIKEADAEGNLAFTFMAGSHDVRRKEYVTLRKKRTNRETGQEEEYEVTKRSQFWDALSEPVQTLLMDAASGNYDHEAAKFEIGIAMKNNVVVFGEIYGSGVQDMTYGFDNGEWGFRAFDMTINGKWVHFDIKKALFEKHGVPMVPILYRGPFSMAKVEEFVSGPTTICLPEKAGKFKGREGIVVTAVRERVVPTEKKVFDRAALKVVSFDYLERKEGTEYH